MITRHRLLLLTIGFAATALGGALIAAPDRQDDAAMPAVATSPIPPIDANAPAAIETATFALG